MSDEIPNLYKNTPQVTLEQRYHGTNVTEEDIARQNEFESGVIESSSAVVALVLASHVTSRNAVVCICRSLGSGQKLC